MDVLNKDPVIYVAMIYFSGRVRHSLHILVISEITIQACTTSAFICLFKEMGFLFWGGGCCWFFVLFLI